MWASSPSRYNNAGMARDRLSQLRVKRHGGPYAPIVIDGLLRDIADLAAGALAVRRASCRQPYGPRNPPVPGLLSSVWSCLRRSGPRAPAPRPSPAKRDLRSASTFPYRSVNCGLYRHTLRLMSSRWHGAGGPRRATCLFASAARSTAETRQSGAAMPSSSRSQPSSHSRVAAHSQARCGWNRAGCDLGAGSASLGCGRTIGERGGGELHCLRCRAVVQRAQVGHAVHHIFEQPLGVVGHIARPSPSASKPV